MLVAAVGALAARLHQAHAVEGLLGFAGLFVPVWWSWWGYTRCSAGFNEDDAVNRVALIVAMLGIGGLAGGVAGAGEAPTSTFVVAYAGLFAVLAVLCARAWRRISQMRALTARYGLAARCSQRPRRRSCPTRPSTSPSATASSR